MRIAIDTRLQNESGVGRYIRNLIKNLQEIDKKNEYVFISTPIHWHTLREQLIMPFVLWRHKPDLVHFPYFNVPIFYFGKFIVTIHDLTILHFDTGLASTHNRFLYKLKRLGYRIILWNAVTRAEAIIVPTHAVKNNLLQKFKSLNEKKVKVIYEGIDERIQISNIQYQYPISPKIKSKPYFLYVGNAYPHKNLRRLLQAFKLTIEQFNNLTVKLILVGREDFFYKRLKKAVNRINLSNKIIFTGRVSDEKLAWLYQNAVAVVFPSLMEGFGLPVLEAMSSGCLVLASDIPALREICADSVVYFDPENPKDIGEKIKSVLESPETYKKYIKKGKRRAKNFSWEKTAKQTLQVYRSVLQNHTHMRGELKRIYENSISL